MWPRHRQIEPTVFTDLTLVLNNFDFVVNRDFKFLSRTLPKFRCIGAQISAISSTNSRGRVFWDFIVRHSICFLAIQPLAHAHKERKMTKKNILLLPVTDPARLVHYKYIYMKTSLLTSKLLSYCLSNNFNLHKIICSVNMKSIGCIELYLFLKSRSKEKLNLAPASSLLKSL